MSTFHSRTVLSWDPLARRCACAPGGQRGGGFLDDRELAQALGPALLHVRDPAEQVVSTRQLLNKSFEAGRVQGQAEATAAATTVATPPALPTTAVATPAPTPPTPATRKTTR